MSRIFGMALAALLFSFAGTALAQEAQPAQGAGESGEGEASALPACRGGRERSEATAGRCCWPGQSWDDDRARCVGPPSSCPEGRVAEGDRCIVDESVPPPRQVVPPPPSGPPPPQGPRLDWPEGNFEGRRNPRREPALDLGLLGAGGGVLALGYVVTLGFGLVDAQNNAPCSDWGYTSLIPLVGGLVWGGGVLSCDSTKPSALVAGVPGSAIQLAGAGIMLVALLIADQPRWIYDEAALRILPRVSVAQGGGEAGLELELTF